MQSQWTQSQYIICSRNGHTRSEYICSWIYTYARFGNFFTNSVPYEKVFTGYFLYSWRFKSNSTITVFCSIVNVILPHVYSRSYYTALLTACLVQGNNLIGLNMIINVSTYPIIFHTLKQLFPTNKRTQSLLSVNARWGHMQQYTFPRLVYIC